MLSLCCNLCILWQIFHLSVLVVELFCVKCEEVMTVIDIMHSI